MEKLNECALIALEVSIPTPGRKATKKDLQRAAPDLPPDQIATMGVFRAFDPKLTNGLQAVKREAERLLSEVGVKFGRMGRVVPPEELERIEKEMEKLRTKFSQKEADMLAAHDAQNAEWINKYPDWAPVLEKKAVSQSELKRKTEFRYHVMHVMPAGSGGDTHKAIAGLSGQLIREVVSDCREILDKSFLGRETVPQKALNGIRTIRRKIAGLAFVAPQATAVRDFLDATLNTMPESGSLSTGQTHAMRSTLHTLADPEALNREIEVRTGSVGFDGGESEDEQALQSDEHELVMEASIDDDETGEAGDVVIKESPASRPAPSSPTPRRSLF
ncbi:hypothetical protein TK90_2874 (plasmid) [Thioalkalivibrio sp. K90mix]|uniref:DUF3150 domain-containing protein n=1 Tax=Thioalkalivibrio sp. (strain K90mix) TaxID=396595 RepID=UPI000195A94A|nr:DUF3150 domain-containing protein [Thioalkalivibrio sp. K90mix]ADC73358.1 hypothetical protein TK90_2874 [Thioalkalivibrio sp. K90mix]